MASGDFEENQLEVMTMNYGAMHKIIDCEALVELGHGEVDKTMEEQVAMVEPAKMETTREKQVGEIPEPAEHGTTAEQKTLGSQDTLAEQKTTGDHKAIVG
ncbi:hypothetical protein Q8A67_012587 [Cirrhinus molitorella]|uniref:Uncharacterized protein n=1 Tax=Cirrhinus molitorella TaxID=172907 RepID=A0AA88PML2_9TELE|nr:hypothetical protein Q8A67_012587 [Cirrhinus molitorella]